MSLTMHDQDREADLERQANALLAAADPDPEYPILLPRQERYRRAREGALPPVIATREAGPSEVFEQWRKREELLAAAELSDKERVTVLLHVHYGWSDREIADLFGCRRATVSERRRVALGKLEKRGPRSVS